MAKQESIVIKKIKKSGGHGGHGGAWKVAYADFVTAMMAFFLVMWLMGSDEETKAAIEHYFNHPNTPFSSGRDPSSDIVRPLGDEVGSGNTILMGVNGIIDEKYVNPDRAWEIEHGNWRIKIEGALQDEKIYGTESTSDLVKFSIPEELIFEPGSAVFNSSAGSHLDKIAEVIKSYKGYFMVTGHTSDRKPSGEEFGNNWDLSSARSTIVLRYFIEKHKYDPKRMTTIGFADQRPMFENTDEKKRKLNSRIEFVLTRKSPIL